MFKFSAGYQCWLIDSGKRSRQPRSWLLEQSCDRNGIFDTGKAAVLTKLQIMMKQVTS